MQVLRFIFILLEVVVLFNLLIIVHELGALPRRALARALHRGVGVWFGKPLWKKTIKRRPYSLGSIPFGGFRSNAATRADGHHRGKLRVSIVHSCRASRRSISSSCAFAVASLACCSLLVFACIVWVVGHPVSEADTPRRSVHAGRFAVGKAGLRVGAAKKILEVDASRVSRFHRE
jgi:regulator of sigma E protease